MKNLSLLKFEEIEPKNESAKFALRLTPFGIPNFVVVIEYIYKLNMLRIVSSIGIGKNIKDNFDKKTEPEKNEIVTLFSKHIRQHHFHTAIPKDFSAIEGSKFLITQNLSFQKLLDVVNESMFLLQDLGELLYQADQSLKVPKVNETASNMFQ